MTLLGVKVAVAPAGSPDAASAMFPSPGAERVRVRSNELLPPGATVAAAGVASMLKSGGTGAATTFSTQLTVSALSPEVARVRTR